MTGFFLNYTSFWERVVAWFQDSWVDRFFTFLREQVFYVPFEQYAHISLSPEAGVTVGGYIFTFLLAFWLVALVTVYVKSVPGGVVRRLLKAGATSPDRALPLAQVGGKRRAVFRDLTRGGALAKLLCRPQDTTRTVAGTPVPAAEEPTVNEEGEAVPSLWERLTAPDRKSAKKEEPSAPETPTAAEGQPENTDAPAPLDPANDSFYIPEGLRARAELRYRRKGNDWIAAAFSILLSTALAIALCKFLPTLFRFANFLLGG